MRARLVGLVAVASVLLAGCGNGEAKDQSPTAASTCVAAVTSAGTAYPAGFPAAWPFPEGAVVTSVEESAGGVLVSAIVSAPFDDVLEFMNGQVSGAGFVSHGGESEEDDAESEWSGNGFEGRWALQASEECEGDTRIEVFSSAG